MADTGFYYHPYYQLYFPQWTLSRDLYLGNPEVMRSQYLTEFQLERGSTDGITAFKQRQARTYYTNYKKAIEQLWITYIFMNDPDVSKIVGNGKLFSEEEAQNIDGNGKSLIDFIKEITSTSIRYGWCYVHVDSPPLQEGASQEAVLQQGIRPYGWVWAPLDVPDWQDVVKTGPDYGKLQIVHRQYLRPNVRRSLSDYPQLETIREQHSFVGNKYERRTYRKRNEQTAQTGSVNNTTITQDIYNNKYVVSNQTQWEEIGPPQGAPWMEQMPIIRSIQEPWTFDVDQKVLQLYQQESSLDNILYYQAYTRIAVAGAPGEQNPQGAAASENTVIWLQNGSQVFQISSEDGTAMTARCADTKNAIFRLGLYQLRQLNAISNAGQAADSQREEKANTYAHAKCRIQEVEDTIYQFFELWGAYKNYKFNRETFSLRKNLTHEDLEEFLMVNEASMTAQDELPELKAEMRKKMIEFLELGDEAKVKIKKQIDASAKKPPVTPASNEPKLQREEFVNGFNGN